MYITINDIIGKKTIDLSYPIHSNKKIAVITMLSDNIQYEVEKSFTFINPISPGKRKLISSKTYAGRELISILRMVDLTDFVNNDRVIKKNKFLGITQMILNLNELDNTDNLEDGRLSNALLTYHVTSDEDFSRF